MGMVYLGYTSGIPVTSGSVIPMTQIIRRSKCSVGTDAIVKGKGYFKVTAKVILASTAGGDAVLTIYKNGTAITGGTATQTIAANGTVTVTFDTVIRNTCCSDIAAITLGYTGPVVTATYATMVIESA